MSIKEMYHYFYYKIYKSMDNEFFHLWADFRAALLLTTFEIITFFSFIIYFVALTKIRINSEVLLFITIVVGCLSAGLHYAHFFAKDRWKEIVAKYDAWPVKKNFMGTLVVWGIVLLLILNIIFAANVMNNTKL